jgi:hypothetical protein
MTIKFIRMALSAFLLMCFTTVASAGGVKGIYLTQYTAENDKLLNHMIENAKKSGIDTFVIDMERPSKALRDNLGLVKQSGIKYVARVVVFPNGGSKAAVENPDVWQKRYVLVKQAIDWGADEIQLDYIRYDTKQKPSPENAKRIHEIIKWFKTKVAAQNIPLQIDVFGETSFGESPYIGQNIKLFSDTVDAICPMVYPSHYTPFAKHYNNPYDTIDTSLDSLKAQFANRVPPMKIYAYIELSNYHYRMSRAQKIDYIKDQIDAVNDAEIDGWYAWSPHNQYDNLFAILQKKS